MRGKAAARAMWAAGLLLAAAAAAANEGRAPKPLWASDLQSQARFDADGEGAPAGVVFLSNDRLLAYVVEKPARVALRPRGEYVGPDAPRLRAMVLDAGSGRAVGSHDLPATGYDVLRVLPNASGGFLVRLQNRIAVYAPDFRSVAQRDLPHRGARDFWVAKVSSSGKTLWLYHSATHTVERFDANTLEPLNACSGVVMTEFSSVSDDKMLTEARQSYVLRNAVCETAALPKLAGNKGRRAPLQCGMAHPLVGEAELAMAGCGQVTFASLLGTVLGEDYFGWKNQVGVFPQVARGQGAVAFWAFQGKGSLASFFGSGGSSEIKKSAIRVYDTTTHSVAAVVELDPKAKLRGFALSPDGNRLGVMEGSVVRVFAVSSRE